MDVEIFVHGVPNGESFWGKDEDRNYFGNFYDQSCSDKVRFFIQTRTSNGKIYCYYNYLVYGNVVGNDGRDGSYFGLSIRFAAYCKDFMNVYKVLDIVFSTYVVNSILKMQNGNYKYIVPDFSNAHDVLKKISSSIWELIQSALTGESFCTLNGFKTNGTQFPSANLYESTSSEVEAAVRQYGKIVISPYYQTSREKTLAKNYEARLNAEKQQCEDRIRANATASKNEITQKENELSLLRTNNSNLASKIAEQKETIQKLNGKIQEHNLTKKNIAIIETIKEPVIELASALGYTAQSNLDDGHKWKLQSFIRYIIPWINTILGVIIISILIFPSKEKNIEQHDDLYVLNDTINMLKAENEDLKSQIQVVEQSKENMIIEDVNHTFGTGSYDAIESPTKPARIDASDYNARKIFFLK